MDQLRAAKAADKAIKAATRRIIDSRPTDVPQWVRTSLPYLKAIRNNDYGFEDPVMCVLYALNNMTHWSGEEARSAKFELNEAIK